MSPIGSVGRSVRGRRLPDAIPDSLLDLEHTAIYDGTNGFEATDDSFGFSHDEEDIVEKREFWTDTITLEEKDEVHSFGEFDHVVTDTDDREDVAVSTDTDDEDNDDRAGIMVFPSVDLSGIDSITFEWDLDPDGSSSSFIAFVSTAPGSSSEVDSHESTFDGGDSTVSVDWESVTIDLSGYNEERDLIWLHANNSSSTPEMKLHDINFD